MSAQSENSRVLTKPYLVIRGVFSAAGKLLHLQKRIFIRDQADFTKAQIVAKGLAQVEYPG